MPESTITSGGVASFPRYGVGQTFTVSPTPKERQEILAERARREQHGYGFQQAGNSRHRLVGFDYGKATLKPAHRQYIRQAVLKEARTFGPLPKFVIRGHTSRSGPSRGNDALAERRAQAVATYIRSLVPVAQVVIQVVGEREPYQHGAPDGSEDFMDRCVEIGVMAQGRRTAQVTGLSGPQADQKRLMAQKHFMQATFQRFLAEAGMVGLLKGIDFTTGQSIRQSTSGRNGTIIRNGMLQYVFNKSWPIIHARHPELSPEQVAQALRDWSKANH